MRLKNAALGTVIMALALGLAFLLPTTLMHWTVPVVVSVGIIALSLGAVRLIDGRFRIGYSAAVALPGLISTWVLTVLPAGFEFSSATGVNSSVETMLARPDLWLAVPGCCIALGLILLFIVQLITGPEQVNRLAQLSLSALVMAVGVTGAGWAVIARDMIRPIYDFFGYPTQVAATEAAGGFGWLSLTVLAGLIVAALLALLPWGKLLTVTFGTLGGTLVTLALNLISPLVLSIPAVAASFIGSLLVVLVALIVHTERDPVSPWLHGGGFQPRYDQLPEGLEKPAPAPALVGVCFGLAPVLASGMVLYFTMWLLTGTF